MAEAGWYPLPSDPNKLVYYDGEKWVGEPVAAPSFSRREREDDGDDDDDKVGLGSLLERAREFATDDKNQGTAMAVAGGAAIADGVVGIGKRPGIGSAIGSIFFGIIFMVVGFNIPGLFMSAMDVEEKRATERETQVQVVDVTYDMKDYCQPYVLVENTRVPLNLPVKSKPCEFTVGEDVGVYYAPGLPSSVRLSGEAADGMKDSVGKFMNLFVWIFAGAGALVAIGGVFQLLMKLGVIAGGSVLMVMGLRKRKAAQERGDNNSAE